MKMPDKPLDKFPDAHDLVVGARARLADLEAEAALYDKNKNLLIGVRQVRMFGGVEVARARLADLEKAEGVPLPRESYE